MSNDQTYNIKAELDRMVDERVAERTRELLEMNDTQAGTISATFAVLHGRDPNDDDPVSDMPVTIATIISERDRLKSDLDAMRGRVDQRIMDAVREYLDNSYSSGTQNAAQELSGLHYTQTPLLLRRLNDLRDPTPTPCPDCADDHCSQQWTEGNTCFVSKADYGKVEQARSVNTQHNTEMDNADWQRTGTVDTSDKASWSYSTKPLRFEDCAIYSQRPAPKPKPPTVEARVEALDNRLESTRDIANNAQERVEISEGDLVAEREQLDALESRVAKHTRRLDHHVERLNDFSERIKALENK